MAKLPNPRAIRAARAYSIDEAADVLHISIGTVRCWIKNGLPAMTAQRPFLILGHDMRVFLQDRRAKMKAPLGPDQLLCLTCKMGRRPLGMMADLHPQNGNTARLVGLCEVCGGTCNRMISCTKLDKIGQIFDLAYRAAK